MPFCAPVTRPAMIMPSITRFGRLRMMKRSLMVPGSLSSALQTTYFSGPRSLRTASHFTPVGNPAPPSPLRPLAFNCAITPSRSREATRLPQRSILLATSVRIGAEVYDLLFGRHLGKFSAAKRREHQRLGLRGGDIPINVVVDRNRRRAIALAQARDIAHRDILLAHAVEALLQGCLQIECAAQMARHVRADAHGDFGRPG